MSNSGASSSPSDTVPWWRTDFGPAEVEGLQQALRERRVTLGPVTAELESRLAEFLGVPHVVATNSGSSALLVSLMAAGVGPGDEVIVPGVSFIASAHAPMLLGATPRLVDVQPGSPVIDPAQVAAAVNERTRAILPVHLNGRSAALEALGATADKHGLHVIEDAAQALGSQDAGGFLGTQGFCGCFSLSITKLITMGEGGMVATRSAEVDAQLRKLRNNGVDALSKNRFDTFGFNLRPTDLLATIGLSQVGHITEKMSALRALYALYAAGIEDIPYLRPIEVDQSEGALPLWMEVLCEDRDKLVVALAQRGIQAKPFPPALCDSAHLDSPPLPVSQFYARHGLVLPSGPDQPHENVQRTIDVLRDLADQFPQPPPQLP